MSRAILRIIAHLFIYIVWLAFMGEVSSYLIPSGLDLCSSRP